MIHLYLKWKIIIKNDSHFSQDAHQWIKSIHYVCYYYIGKFVWFNACDDFKWIHWKVVNLNNLLPWWRHYKSSSWEKNNKLKCHVELVWIRKCFASKDVEIVEDMKFNLWNENESMHLVFCNNWKTTNSLHHTYQCRTINKSTWNERIFFLF